MESPQGNILTDKKNRKTFLSVFSFSWTHFVTIPFSWATSCANFFTSFVVNRWKNFDIYIKIFVGFSIYSSTSFIELVSNLPSFTSPEWGTFLFLWCFSVVMGYVVFAAFFQLFTNFHAFYSRLLFWKSTSLPLRSFSIPISPLHFMNLSKNISSLHNHKNNIFFVIVKRLKKWNWRNSSNDWNMVNAWYEWNRWSDL